MSSSNIFTDIFCLLDLEKMASKVLIHRESTGMQCVWVHSRIVYRGKNELISCCMVKVEVSQEFLWEYYVKKFNKENCWYYSKFIAEPHYYINMHLYIVIIRM